MPTLATRAASVFGASVGERPSLKRQRDVAAVAPAACGEMLREKFARRVVATEPSAPPAPKRVCRGFDVKIREESFAVGKESVAPASASERLKQRMEAEREALDSLVKKAVLLSRGSGRGSVVLAGEYDAPIVAAKRQLDSAETTAAKMRKSTPSNPASGEVAKRCTEPKKQQPVVQRAAPRTTQDSMASRIDKAKEVQKKRHLEEIARARKKFRQELLEVEKAAMPDKTIYPEELEELGIAAFQYVVTRTRKQVQLGSG